MLQLIITVGTGRFSLSSSFLQTGTTKENRKASDYSKTELFFGIWIPCWIFLCCLTAVSSKSTD